MKANALSSINALKKQINAGGWVWAEQASFDGTKEMEEKLHELRRNNEELKRSMQKIVEEKERIVLQLKKVETLYQDSSNREKKIVSQYENVKKRIAELVEEMGLEK